MKGTIRFGVPALVGLAALGLSPLSWPPAYAQNTEAAKTLGKRLICMCGCNQILTACNHVGCTTSAAMLKRLDQVVARNEPEDLALQSFVQEYGERVMAEPPARGFHRIAWYIPGAALALGLVIVVVVISHWRRRVATAAGGPEIPEELLARARQETDRETEE